MKLLWLVKRTQCGKDLFTGRFGRYHHLPRELERLGVRSHLLMLSYRRPGRSRREEEGVIRESADLPSYASALAGAVAEARPDAVVGGLDSLYCIVGGFLAARRKIPLLLDLSDNFESFASARFPGIPGLFKRSLRSASLVTCVSPALAAHSRTIARQARVECLENGVDGELFRPRERSIARWRWRVDDEAIAFGYVGALHPNRGLATLFEAWPAVKQALPGAELLLAGRRHRALRVPQLPGLRYLGDLPHEEVPSLLGALDAALVFTLPNAFGRYCFPLKFQEASAMGVPVIVAGEGVLERWVDDEPGIFFPPRDALALAARLVALPKAQRRPGVPVARWSDLAVRYAGWLSEVVR